MQRRTAALFLFSKPVTQGYVHQLFPEGGGPAAASQSCPGKHWARAMASNREVRDHFTPTSERYEEWYKETYGLDDLSDGRAASGASSNRLLNDANNLEQAAAALDKAQVDFSKEELHFWSNEFNHNTFVQ